MGWPQRGRAPCDEAPRRSQPGAQQQRLTPTAPAALAPGRSRGRPLPNRSAAPRTTDSPMSTPAGSPAGVGRVRPRTVRGIARTHVPVFRGIPGFPCSLTVKFRSPQARSGIRPGENPEVSPETPAGPDRRRARPSRWTSFRTSPDPSPLPPRPRQVPPPHSPASSAEPAPALPRAPSVSPARPPPRYPSVRRRRSSGRAPPGCRRRARASCRTPRPVPPRPACARSGGPDCPSAAGRTRPAFPVRRPGP